IERGADRKSAFIKRLVAVLIDDLAAYFFGEKFRGENGRAVSAASYAERLALGFIAIGLRHVTVFDHAIDYPVAASDGGLGMAEGIVVGGSLGQRGEIGRFRNRKISDRLVEIGE